jgi:hypothetical protein
MSSKAYELLTQIKDLALISGTTEDNSILRKMNLAQWDIYNAYYPWRDLETTTTLPTTELMTLTTAPTTRWAVGDTITGQTSTETCIIVDILSTLTYNVKDRSGDFTLGETLTNGTTTAAQHATIETAPSFVSNSYVFAPSSMAKLYSLVQDTDSPYTKLAYLPPRKFQEIIPQPTMLSEGKPTYYTWFGGKIWFYPIPDSTYDLKVYMYKKPVNMKLYSTGSVTQSTITLTGTSTKWLDNNNVDTTMFFTREADLRSDGTLPWAQIATVTANGTMTVFYTYTGATTTGAHICSSEATFTEEFDTLLIARTIMLLSARLREFEGLLAWAKETYSSTLGSLVSQQRDKPDYEPMKEDFTPSGTLLGDSAYKFPFIKGDR